MINVNVSGTVKFFDQKKGFGIIATEEGDVFIHVTKAGGRQEELVTNAKVKIDFEAAYKDGQYKKFATSLISIQAPPAPVEVLDVFKFYDVKKGYGFFLCPDAGFCKGEAFASWQVAKKAGITPGEGMPARAMVVEKNGSVEVVSFEWGPEVEAAYAAKLKDLHADDAPVPETEVEALVEKPAAKKQRRAPKAKAVSKPAKKATSKKQAAKPASKKAAETPTDVAATVAQCASQLNGSGGTMAAAMMAASSNA